MSSFDETGQPLMTRMYYSVGGGFVVNEDTIGEDRIILDETPIPYPFTSGQQLLELCHEHGLSISRLMLNKSKTLPKLAWNITSD